MTRTIRRPLAGLFVVLFAQMAWAQEAPQGASEATLEARIRTLEAKLQALEESAQADELARMQDAARAEANARGSEGAPEQREFLEGALALQKLNPEISVSGDVLAALVIDGDRFYAGADDRSGMPIREVSLHIQHVLDPYSMFKSAIAFSPTHGVGVEEVYVTWSGLVPSLTFTVGRFRQGFGVLNRWHEHDLDQTAHPFAMTAVLGEEGLVGNGFGVRWFMPPLWAHANELTLEVVDGENEALFAGQHFSVPTALLHLKSYWDLTDSTYLELGLSGMFGFHNRRGLVDETTGTLVDEPWAQTYVGGADLTLYWSPLQQAKYYSVTWRSELYCARKQQPAGSALPTDWGFGAYSYVQVQPGERWFLGVRGDVARPMERASDDLAWDVVPYVTFWQSEFVYLRLEVQHGQRLPVTRADGTLGARTDNRVLLQVDFAAGPHKHEKY